MLDERVVDIANAGRVLVVGIANARRVIVVEV